MKKTKNKNQPEDQKQRYEKYWLERGGKNTFDIYERNIVLKKFLRNSETFLDLASGDSSVGAYVKKNYNCDAYALDISKKAILIANEKGVKGYVGGVEEPLPFNDSFFDTVFWGDNIEHIWHPSFTVKEIHRVLKPKGRLILSTPNMGYWRYRTKYFLTGVLPRSEGQVKHPWEWEHIRFFNKKTIYLFLENHKFKPVRFAGSTPRRSESLLSKLYPSLFSSVMLVEAELVKK